MSFLTGPRPFVTIHKIEFQRLKMLPTENKLRNEPDGQTPWENCGLAESIGEVINQKPGLVQKYGSTILRIYVAQIGCITNDLSQM